MIYKYPTLRITEIVHSLDDGLIAMTGNEAASLVSEAADIIRDYKLGNQYQFVAEHLHAKAEEIRKAPHSVAEHNIAISSRIFIQDYFKQL